MVITYYIKLFRAEADRHSNILMCLLLLVTETKIFHTLLKDIHAINKRLLIDSLFKRYETTNFSNKVIIARKFCKQAPVYFYHLPR